MLADRIILDTAWVSYADRKIVYMYPAENFSQHSHEKPKKNWVLNLCLSLVLLAGCAGILTMVFGTQPSGFTGTGIVLDDDIRGQKCMLEVRREDGKEVRQSAGYRNECGKYEKGQTVYFDRGVIDDEPS